MDGNFYIYTDLSALPVDEHEAYLAEGFGGVCTGGTAVIEVFSVSRRISKNDLVTVLPLQSVLIREVSPDFSMTFFKIDKTMFLDTMSSLGKITPDFFFYMRKNFQVRLTRGEVQRFLGFCRAIDFRNSSGRSRFPAGNHIALVAYLLLGFLCSFPQDRKPGGSFHPLEL